MAEVEQLFQTPRINGNVLRQFAGRTVCVVGESTNYQEGAEEARLKTSDGVFLNVQLAPGSCWTSRYVEVIGHLHPDNKLQEFKSTDFGDAFDLPMYNNMVELMTGAFSSLFYAAQEE